MINEDTTNSAPEPTKVFSSRNRKPKRENRHGQQENSATVKNQSENNGESATVNITAVTNNSDTVGETVPKFNKAKKPHSKKKPKQEKLASEKEAELEKSLNPDEANHVDGKSQHQSASVIKSQSTHHTSPSKTKTKIKHNKKDLKKPSSSIPEGSSMEQYNDVERQALARWNDSANILDGSTSQENVPDNNTVAPVPQFHDHSRKTAVSIVGEPTTEVITEEVATLTTSKSKSSTRQKKNNHVPAIKEQGQQIEEIDYKDLDNISTPSKHHKMSREKVHRDFVPGAKHGHNGPGKAKPNSDSDNWRATAAPPKISHSNAPPKDLSNGKVRKSIHPDDFNPRNRRELFQKFMPEREVLPLLESKKLYKGTLRINRRNRHDAYVTSDDLEYDIYIHGPTKRNRALDGDIVAVELRDVDEVWASKKAKDEKDADMKKDQVNPFAPKDEREIEIIPSENESCTNDEDDEDDEERRKPKYCGVVVAILDRSQEPLLTGTISLNRLGAPGESVPNKTTNNDERRPTPTMFWIKPTDKRVPFVALNIRQAPQGFIEDEEQFAKKLFVARITRWPITEKHPFGELVQELGNVGDLEVEAKALLAENCINDQEFPKAALACLPITPWHIPAVEFTKRRDMRFHRIFTIDPETAKDLDDAVHITDKGNGQYEVGVHIADVSFFIRSKSPLDTEARSRGTSTYLVDRVIPMLPSLLCEELCSLNPGVERLAFSVIWQMDQFGSIQDTWFGRTIIRSCGKLSYQHAQDVIEGRRLSSSLRLHGHDAEVVEKDILNLYHISKHLRKARYDNGALSMNSVKLYFDLDDAGKPVGCHVYEQKDANRLIEEFMLCANISVAKKIASKFPDEALLRRHAPPIERRLEEFLIQAENLGYVLDGSSAGALQASFNEIESPEVKETLLILAIKPMQRAKYFCTGLLDISKYKHYALNVQMYTHFTSPIRRYADVIVHRQLEAALNDVDHFPMDSKEIAKIAHQCNIKKDGAKNAQDASIELYLAEYLLRQNQLYGPIYCDATIVAVFDAAYDIFIPEYGIEKRLHLDRMALKKSTYDAGNHTLTLTWNPDAIEMNEVTESKSNTLSFDDDDTCDDDDLVQAIENQLSMKQGKVTSETTSNSSASNDILTEDTTVHLSNATSEKSNGYMSSQHYSDSPAAPNDTQIIKVFEKVKVRLEVDANKSPPMINVHSVNPHVLV